MSIHPILQIKDLVVSFQSGKKFVPAVDGISFELNEGEILGIVGESGSGKSVTSLTAMGLIPSPPGKIENGEILFEGKDLKKISEKEWRKIRGNQLRELKGGGREIFLFHFLQGLLINNLLERSLILRSSNQRAKHEETRAKNSNTHNDGFRRTKISKASRQTGRKLPNSDISNESGERQLFEVDLEN